MQSENGDLSGAVSGTAIAFRGRSRGTWNRDSSLDKLPRCQSPHLPLCQRGASNGININCKSREGKHPASYPSSRSPPTLILMLTLPITDSSKIYSTTPLTSFSSPSMLLLLLHLSRASLPLKTTNLHTKSNAEKLAAPNPQLTVQVGKIIGKEGKRRIAFKSKIQGPRSKKSCERVMHSG